MKGNQGRRGPLSGLSERFSIDFLRREKQSAEDKRNADAIQRLMDAAKRLAVERESRPYVSGRLLRKPTKRPMTIVRAERRAANRNARKARRRNRVH